MAAICFWFSNVTCLADLCRRVRLRWRWLWKPGKPLLVERKRLLVDLHSFTALVFYASPILIMAPSSVTSSNGLGLYGSREYDFSPRGLA